MEDFIFRIFKFGVLISLLPLITSGVVGVLVNIFNTIFQINDSSITHVTKLIVVTTIIFIIWFVFGDGFIENWQMLIIHSSKV